MTNEQDTSTKAQDTRKEGTMVKYADLRLGDIVDLRHSAYSTATVKQIRKYEEYLYVTFFRPYVHTSDFSYTGGVITYIGIEEFESPSFNGQMEVMLLQKGRELK